MKAIQHFERSLACEHRSQAMADVEAGDLPAKRPRKAPGEGRDGKRFTGAYVPGEVHAALNALAKKEGRTLSSYLRRVYAGEIKRHAGLLAKRN